MDLTNNYDTKIIDYYITTFNSLSNINKEIIIKNLDELKFSNINVLCDFLLDDIQTLNEYRYDFNNGLVEQLYLAIDDSYNIYGYLYITKKQNKGMIYEEVYYINSICSFFKYRYVYNMFF